jgi:hypothetical protein
MVESNANNSAVISELPVSLNEITLQEPAEIS